MPSKPNSSGGAIVYLDCNATTLMPQTAIDAMVRWCNRGNPSAEYASAQEARKMMDAFRHKIAVECGFELGGPTGYTIIFTSGASESNCHIVTSTVRSYMAKTKHLPHIITSAVEHKSLLSCCLRLAKEGLCQLTVLPVGRSGPGLGAVHPDDLKNAIRLNTCLVTIMAANNETGVLNNLHALSTIARRTNIPFHTDAVQLFGKGAMHPNSLGIDAFSVSFHKLHGPPGIGLLVLRQSLVDGYDLCPHICGSQNGGLRGGTENLQGIAAAFAAFRHTMTDRTRKTARMQRLRDAIKITVATRLPCFYLDEHPADRPPSIDGGITDPPPPVHNGSQAARRAIALSEKGGAPVVFWIAPADVRRVLPNTLLLSVRRPGFCNKAARSALETRGVIVSIGSACNSSEASHGNASSVVTAMAVPRELQGGVLRVSLGDDTTEADIKSFVFHFIAVVASTGCLSSQWKTAHHLK